MAAPRTGRRTISARSGTSGINQFSHKKQRRQLGFSCASCQMSLLRRYKGYITFTITPNHLIRWLGVLAGRCSSRDLPYASNQETSLQEARFKLPSAHELKIRSGTLQKLSGMPPPGTPCTLHSGACGMRFGGFGRAGKGWRLFLGCPK